MYLSRLVLNPRSSAVRRDLADCYQLHRTVMSAFDDLPAAVQDARAQLGVLYRVDADPCSGRMALLVQSRAEPNWSRLPGEYLLTGPEWKSIDRAIGLVKAGDRLTFRLRANPTRRISKTNTDEERRWRGRRVNLRDETDWLAWLRRKAVEGGFCVLAVSAHDDVPAVQARDDGKIKGERTTAQDWRRPLTFASVLFDGRLEVADADLFGIMIEHGIGSGKAFGFGLLSIAPAG